MVQYIRFCVAVFVFLASALASATGDSDPSTANQAPAWHAYLELGPTWQSRNEFRIPGTSGTLVRLQDLETGPFLAQRVYLGYRWGASKQHEVRGLLAPFTASVVSELPEAVNFQGQSFAPGTPTTATYQFNSYRVTYRYQFFNGASWKWQVGFTAKIRDARIALAQGATSAQKLDVGFVPLLHLHGDWLLSERWALVLDVDALAAPQGRAEDVLLALQWNPYPGWSCLAGYRMVEGGAENDQVFTFAWLHTLALGLQFAW